jgi:hypothetical protein
MVASSQLTSRPSIQILSTFWIGIPLGLLADVLGDQIADL